MVREELKSNHSGQMRAYIKVLPTERRAPSLDQHFLPLPIATGAAVNNTASCFTQSDDDDDDEEDDDIEENEGVRGALASSEGQPGEGDAEGGLTGSCKGIDESSAPPCDETSDSPRPLAEGPNVELWSAKIDSGAQNSEPTVGTRKAVVKVEGAESVEKPSSAGPCSPLCSSLLLVAIVLFSPCVIYHSPSSRSLSSPACFDL